MNYKNSKTTGPYRLLLNLADKMNIRRSGKYVALSNRSTYYTCNKTKKSYNNNRFKISALMKNLSYVTDHILYQTFKIISGISSKKMK